MTDRFARIFVLPLLLLFFLPASSLHGEDSVDAAWHRLKGVEIFAIGPVGYAGTTSSGEKDFRHILLQTADRALKLFNDLYEDGNVQAKTYALAGIKKLDPAKFKALRESSGNAKTMVKVEEGCVVSYRDMREIAKDIDAGKFPYDK